MRFEKPFAEIDDNWAYYASAYYLVKGIGKLALGVKFYGTENIPPQGRAIIASNHRHWLDIFIIPIAIPNRHLSMVAKKEVYDTPIMGKLFTRWETIPVDRKNAGPSTTKEAIRRLKQERVVGILPEGHRYQMDELGEMHGGVAQIARLGKAPTVPAAVRGADSLKQAFLHRSAEVVYGSPIEYPESKKDEAEYMLTLRRSIQELYDS